MVAYPDEELTAVQLLTGFRSVRTILKADKRKPFRTPCFSVFRKEHSSDMAKP